MLRELCDRNPGGRRSRARLGNKSTRPTPMRAIHFREAPRACRRAARFDARGFWRFDCVCCVGDRRTDERGDRRTLERNDLSCRSVDVPQAQNESARRRTASRCPTLRSICCARRKHCAAICRRSAIPRAARCPPYAVRHVPDDGIAPDRNGGVARADDGGAETLAHLTTTHGLRSAFSTSANDRKIADSETLSKARSHTRNATASKQHTTAPATTGGRQFERDRVRLWHPWGSFLTAAPTSNVVAFPRL